MKIFIAGLLAVLVSGCASFESASVGTGTTKVGLLYYMPKKDVVITATVASKKITAVSIDLSPAYPDISNAYLLNHSRNWIGKNVSEIEINQGLLTSSKATVTSGVGDVLKGVAATAGALGALAFDGEKKAPPCADGTYKNIIDVTQKTNDTICGLSIAVKKHFSQTTSMTIPKPDESTSGVFYRQNLPYDVDVTASSNLVVASALVFSPSESPTYFLPIAKTLFANNNAEFTFNDGVVTKYKQDTDGELIGLLKLPADVIGAYFSAAGGVFDAFKTRNTSEAGSLDESLKLELAKKKYDACLAAIKANDQTQITALSCSS